MELRRSFESNSEILKLYFRLIIGSLMRNLEKSGKLAIKYKLWLRLFLFFHPKYNIWCVAHSAICVLQGLREEKNE